MFWRADDRNHSRLPRPPPRDPREKWEQKLLADRQTPAVILPGNGRLPLAKSAKYAVKQDHAIAVIAPCVLKAFRRMMQTVVLDGGEKEGKPFWRIGAHIGMGIIRYRA